MSKRIQSAYNQRSMGIPNSQMQILRTTEDEEFEEEPDNEIMKIAKLGK